MATTSMKMTVDPRVGIGVIVQKDGPLHGISTTIVEVNWRGNVRWKLDGIEKVVQPKDVVMVFDNNLDQLKLIAADYKKRGIRSKTTTMPTVVQRDEDGYLDSPN